MLFPSNLDDLNDPLIFNNNASRVYRTVSAICSFGSGSVLASSWLFYNYARDYLLESCE
ncbi:hypothetical protein ASPZODRAFT_126680 [Penicilliopsis zonata CBS 506.65]|uniref:Uncharacterized protein n=1 Tax=Penicilliopsis zonata CBS 506.65 TaxID=1073090 RepID=A0A1L9SUJ6_9EURO|nr:hypothetical protein ASPZODRAFT_126680 [Penicilliopsis zonata CBS 506.65]OJJ50757.1 hypothetical protein ASPZODRAFT_126680 [Penicilliopsis zonata CBS 506.65]